MNITRNCVAQARLRLHDRGCNPWHLLCRLVHPGSAQIPRHRVQPGPAPAVDGPTKTHHRAWCTKRGPDQRQPGGTASNPAACSWTVNTLYARETPLQGPGLRTPPAYLGGLPWQHQPSPVPHLVAGGPLLRAGPSITPTSPSRRPRRPEVKKPCQHVTPSAPAQGQTLAQLARLLRPNLSRVVAPLPREPELCPEPPWRPPKPSPGRNPALHQAESCTPGPMANGPPLPRHGRHMCSAATQRR